MRASSLPPRLWTDAPPATADALAHPTAAWGSRRARLPSPRAVRLANVPELAWALCAPPDAPAFLSAWNPRTARVAWRFELPRAGVFDVSPDGRLLVFSDATGWCVALDAARGVELASFHDGPGDPGAVVVARADVDVALIARAGRVRRWDLRTLRATVDVAGHCPVALSPDGASMAFVDRERVTVTATRPDGDPVSFRARRGTRVTALDLGAEGTLAIGLDDGGAMVCPLARGARRFVPSITASPVTALRVRADGRRLAVGHHDGRAHDHDLTDATSDARGLRGDGAVGAIAPSLEAALHLEANAAVLLSLDPVERFDLRAGHSDAITAVAIARDGRTAVTASRDGTLRVWDPRTGETLDALEGHNGPVRSLALSPDGRFAWSSGDRDGLRTWDLSRSTELAHAPALARVDALVVSPDGSRLLAQVAAASGVGASSLLLDAHDGRVLARAAIPSLVRGALGFIAQGQLAVLAFATSIDGDLRLTCVDARSGDDPFTVIVPATARAHLLHRLTTEGHLATATTDRAELSIRDVASGAVLARHASAGPLLLHRHLTVGARVALGTTGGAHVDLCDLRSGARAALRLPHRNDSVTALALGPDERWFVAGTAQGIALRYELRARETPAELS